MTTRKIQTLSLRNVSRAESQEPNRISVARPNSWWVTVQVGIVRCDEIIWRCLEAGFGQEMAAEEKINRHGSPGAGGEPGRGGRTGGLQLGGPRRGKAWTVKRRMVAVIDHGENDAVVGT